MTDNDSITRLRLRVGDVVEVRSEAEILATLDDNGAIGGLPFMPEMLAYSGQRFRVHKRADKTCDTINFTGGRRLLDSVHLEGMRCTGAGHGGCQAQCTILWKEAWLRRVDDAAPAPTTSSAGTTRRAGLSRERLDETTRRPPEDGEVRYRCQATDLLLATKPLPWWDLRQYVRDVWSGNVGLMAVVRALLFRGLLQTLRITAHRAQLSLYDKLQARRGGTPFPYIRGTLDKTPHATLGLQSGEHVRVRPKDEIVKTIDRRNRNRGLSFDPEMVRYCERTHRVRARVERLIDEKTGKMREVKGGCIILEDVVCRAEYSHGRLFCPRELYPYWREIWLERTGAQSPDAAPRSEMPTPP